MVSRHDAVAVHCNENPFAGKRASRFSNGALRDVAEISLETCLTAAAFTHAVPGFRSDGGGTMPRLCISLLLRPPENPLPWLFLHPLTHCTQLRDQSKPLSCVHTLIIYVLCHCLGSRVGLRSFPVAFPSVVGIHRMALARRRRLP